MNRTTRPVEVRYCPRCGLLLSAGSAYQAGSDVCRCAGRSESDPTRADWLSTARGNLRRSLLARLQELVMLTSSRGQPRPRWLRPAWLFAILACVTMMITGFVARRSGFVVAGIALTGFSTAALWIASWHTTRPARRETGTALEVEIDRTRQRLAELQNPTGNKSV